MRGLEGEHYEMKITIKKSDNKEKNRERREKLIAIESEDKRTKLKIKAFCDYA